MNLERWEHALKLVFTQEFVQFFWWYSSEGFVGGSKDCVDSFPIKGLCQPSRLDSGYQHARDIHIEDVTYL